ncbi:MAG: hypothetical protein AAF696_30590 [Bacteroidota bacterium]
MKNFILGILLFGVLAAFAPLVGTAASSMPKAPEAVETQAKTKKELRKQKRAEKIANFIQKRVEKRIAKLEKKRKKGSFSDLDRNLQLAIIFGVGAVALSILGYFLPFLWVLSGLAWLIGIVFLVLWLIENA